jgi:hypothetical protein
MILIHCIPNEQRKSETALAISIALMNCDDLATARGVPLRMWLPAGVRRARMVTP